MTRGRIPKDDAERAGHRPGVGEGEQIEVLPVESRLIGASAPADLSPLATEVWDICVADMVALGHLREPDLLQLRNYAVEVAIAIEAEATIAEFGAMMKEPIIVNGDDGPELVGYKLKTNPACKLHRDAAQSVRLLASDLALTPIARIRGNLMAAATASIALGIKDELESELDAEDLASPKRRKRSK